MWPARFSLPKLLFFAMRYYIFVNNIFNALCEHLEFSCPSILT